MIGLVNNYNANGTPRIIDAGSSDQALKVLTVYGPKTTVDYLQLLGFAEGRRKPFLFISHLNVITGSCVPYRVVK